MSEDEFAIGRSECASDVASVRQARLLADLLDHEVPPWREGVLPPLAHWLMFPPQARQSCLGEDGHPRRTEDSLLPQAPDLPRRMWVGSQIEFLSDISLGETVQRETTLLSAQRKTGRSGKMLFAKLRHRLSVNGETAIEEEQDLVYREAQPQGTPAAPRQAKPPEAAPRIVHSMRADPVRLFRYSALTYNAHRIHYDRDYATGVEGFPALVVHGQFTATLLLDHFFRHNPGARLTRCAFRAVSPLFDTDDFTLGFTPQPDGAELVARNPDGGVAMTGEATIA